MIGVAGRAGSTLLKQADVTILLPAAPEACSIGMAPTTSTTMTLALGDALAVALMEHRNITPEQFRDFHPGGKLGARLHLDVALYQQGGNLPDVDNDISFRRLLINTYGRGFLFTPLTYGLEFGSSDGSFYLQDGYVWLHEVPYIRSAKLGIFAAPMSMQMIQSSSTKPMTVIAHADWLDKNRSIIERGLDMPLVIPSGGTVMFEDAAYSQQVETFSVAVRPAHTKRKDH